MYVFLRQNSISESWLFGRPAIQKYLSGKTYISSSVKHSDSIPLPGIAIIPQWHLHTDPISTGLCPYELGQYFWTCVENFTYPIETVTPDLNVSWFKTFQPYSGIIFTQNFSAQLSTNTENSYKINILGYINIPGYPNSSFHPEVWLHDPKYFMISSNPKTFPKISLIDNLDMAQKTVHIYLEVFKITKMNKQENPCEEDENYSLTDCIKNFINKESSQLIINQSYKVRKEIKIKKLHIL